MQKNISLSQNGAKYKNARYSLLLIVILSAINLFSMIFADVYFLFSAYLPQILFYAGYLLYSESGMIRFLIVADVFAVITIIPYLLCWIFSKKRVGWMIAALVIFSLDSLLFLIDYVPYIIEGNFDGVLDLLIRVWALGSLILGVKYGFRAKKDVSETPAISDNGDTSSEEIWQETRTITVTRKKSFVGCAALLVCHINGREVCTLKNGETRSFAAPIGEFILYASLSNGLGMGEVTVPAVVKMEYDLKVKMGMTASKVVITPVEEF